MADCDEETIDVAPIAFAGLQVPKRDTSDRLLADVMDFIDYRVSHHLDLRVGDSAVNHDLRCPERVPSMNQSDFFTEARQEVCLFHGRISTSDHHDLLAAVEESIARRTRTDTMSNELLLGRQIQPPR